VIMFDTIDCNRPSISPFESSRDGVGPPEPYADISNLSIARASRLAAQMIGKSHLLYPRLWRVVTTGELQDDIIMHKALSPLVSACLYMACQRRWMVS